MDTGRVLEESLTQARRRNMVVLMSTTLLIVGARFTWWRLIPLHLRTLNASDQQVGLVFTVMWLLGPAQLVGGLISDRWGRRFAIAIPSLILVPILIFGALARHWLWLAFMLWLVGIISSMQRPGFQALLAESATDDDRGRVFGGFHTIVALAMMLGPAVGAALLPLLGISGLIWATAILALIAGLGRLLLLREGQFASVASRASQIGLGEILREPLFRRLIVVNSLFLLLLSLTRDGPFVTLHAADSLGLDEQAVNLLFAIGGTGAAAISVVGGALSDRIGGRRSSALGLGLHVLLLLLWGILGWDGWPGAFLFGLSWIMLQIGVVGYLTWFSVFAPAAVRGRVLGLVGAIASIISAAGPQLGTWLRSASLSLLTGLSSGAHPEEMAQLASSTPFALALMIALLLGVLVLRMPGRHELARWGLGTDEAELPPPGPPSA